MGANHFYFIGAILTFLLLLLIHYTDFPNYLLKHLYICVYSHSCLIENNYYIRLMFTTVANILNIQLTSILLYEIKLYVCAT